MMNDYKAHLYDESFEMEVLDFNTYVQEGVGLVAAAIVGVAALVTAIILLIKKFFFKKDSPESLWSTLIRIKTKLNSSTAQGDIVYIKGKVDINALGRGILNIQEIIKLMNSMIEVIETPEKANAYVNDINAQMKAAEQNLNAAYTGDDSSTWTKYESRKALIDGCEKLMENAKNIASEVKKLNTSNEKLKKNTDTNKPGAKTDFTKFYASLTKTITNATKQASKIDKNIALKQPSGSGELKNNGSEQ